MRRGDWSVKDATIGMILASVIGAAAGIYYATTLNPLNNYIFLVLLFAMIGIGVANLVFLVLIEVYRWLRQYCVKAEEAQSIRT